MVTSFALLIFSNLPFNSLRLVRSSPQPAFISIEVTEVQVIHLAYLRNDLGRRKKCGRPP